MKRQKRTSLQDIANKVGVTKMTVSRFLNNPNLVATETAEKISSVIDILGYMPNRTPNMLLSSKSNMIGVLIPSLTNLVFSEVLRGIESVATPADYQTLLAHYGYSQQKEEQCIASLLSYNVDGLLLSESIHTPKTIKMIEQSGIPVIEMMEINSHSHSSHNTIQSVGFNNFQAAQEMVVEMIIRKHTNIVYLGARMDSRTHIKMLGYQKAMQLYGIKPRTILTEDASSFSLGANLLKRALSLYPETDGIFCTNDDLAIGAMFECQRQNIKVPQELAIAGFHGHDVGQSMYPKLATVITPLKQIGKVSAQILIERLSLSEDDMKEQINKDKRIDIDLGFNISVGESI